MDTIKPTEMTERHMWWTTLWGDGNCFKQLVSCVVKLQSLWLRSGMLRTLASRNYCRLNLGVRILHFILHREPKRYFHASHESRWLKPVSSVYVPPVQPYTAATFLFVIKYSTATSEENIKCWAVRYIFATSSLLLKSIIRYAKTEIYLLNFLLRKLLSCRV